MAFGNYNSKRGNVTFNNADKFYEIMYKLKDSVHTASIKSSFENYGTVVVYYKILKQLWKHVASYLKDKKVEEVLRGKIKEDIYNAYIMSNNKNNPSAKKKLKHLLRMIIDDLEETEIKLYRQMKEAKLELPVDFSKAKNAILDMGD